MELLEGFFWGIVGGAGAELLGLFRLRHEAPEAFPNWLETTLYWGVTIAMILFGGLLVIAYLRSDMPVNPILALNVGAAAPALLSSFMAQAPRIEPGTIN